MYTTGYISKSTLLEGEGEVSKSKMVAKATIKMVFPDGTEKLKYHNTILVTKSPDGTITLNSGGYRTSTTKDRINEYSPISIYQNKGIWYVGDRRNQDEPSVVFFDGIQFKDGKCISEVKEVDMKEIARVKKMISTYCNLITEDNIPFPDSGDCWYCLMVTNTDNGKQETLGDSWNDNSHLWSHMEEGYVVGSLLINAMRESGLRDMQIGMHLHMKYVESIRRCVRKYLTKRLLPEIARN
jgi:hypothetical protein